jgi:glycosyltransferase involved in cell wall biosynthesis
MKTPILFLTDSPDCPSGLARIGRDLARLVHRELGDDVEVGYLGRGGVGGKFPFPTWVIPHNLYGSKSVAEWGSTVIEEVWKEFAGDRKGVVFSIWDPGRMIWLSQPQYLMDSPEKSFLMGKPFKTWGYFPVDGETDSGGLGVMAGESLKGYDRVLAYTPYGAKVMSHVLERDVQWIPHMLDNGWFPRDKHASREFFSFPKDSFILGVVATNQRRKDWGLAAQIGSQLKYLWGDKFRQWWHIDQPVKDWNVMELCSEYKLETSTIITMPPQRDDWMGAAYSCCDVTLAIGSEGFGYPIVESQACGVPVVHGNYAGGAVWVPPQNLIEPTAYMIEGLSAIRRPVYDPDDWVAKIRGHIYPGAPKVGDMEPLRWHRVWPKWKKWFMEGLNEL